MFELTPRQLSVLERIASSGFRLVAFPLYASRIGVRRGECAALLHPVEGGGMALVGDAFYMVGENPGVRMKRAGRDLFVFKKNEVEVTPARQAELRKFRDDLERALQLQ